MKKATLKLALEALKQAKRRVAVDAAIAQNIGETETYPFAQKALKQYKEYEQAIKEIEEELHSSS